MVLWDIIRDWFVVYVWGGYTSTGTYYGLSIGKAYSTSGGNQWGLDLNSIKALDVSLDNRFVSINGHYGLSDYLSTLSTLLVFGLMCFALYLIIRYMFRLTAGLIRGH